MRLPSTAWARLASFGVALAATFGVAYAVGNATAGAGDSSGTTDGGHAGHASATTVPASTPVEADAPVATIDEAAPHTHDTTPRPATTSAEGYELRLDGSSADAHTLDYRVVGPDGATVTSFQDNHGALLHAVLVRPDLSGFQHVHPTIGADGTWTVTIPEGPWHLVFDVWPTGAASNVVLSTNADDEVPVATVPLPAPADTVATDGLVVRRDGLTFTVTTPDGAPATGLEPFLGAPAHLVLLREGDLAFTHLHPTGTAMPDMPDMPDMSMPADHAANVFTFTGDPPSGTYRAFLQFGHDGDVVTAPFTVVVP